MVATESPKNTDPWQRWISERGEAFLLYARQQTRTEEDAHDVLQEALAECWRRVMGQVPDAALVYTTIRRRAIDLGRSTSSRHRREAAHSWHTETWFQPDFSAQDTHRTVAAALASLSEEFRECVTLRLWGELSFPQIAEITGVPTATAASRYRYALERLREILGPLFT